MGSNSTAASSVISLPKSGGALHGIGETFSPDLHTGTGNFTVPITLPPGRNGFQPQLNLVYSTGNGNGPFGLGWSLSVPGVTRKTANGIPRYRDGKDADTFILSGAEDLVPVGLPADGIARFRPRTEGLFARIDRHRENSNDYWEVRSKDGLRSLYGTPRPENAAASWRDGAVITDPDRPDHIFAWKLTRTTDPFGNRIEYTYDADAVQTEDGDSHRWDQRYLSDICYVDYGDPASPQFLVKVHLAYEDRPDHFSDYRSGFEIRTIRRCTKIEISTNAGAETVTRVYHLVYLDQQRPSPEPLPANGVSLLSQIWVEGRNGTADNVLANPSFEAPGPDGPSTAFTGSPGPANSAAADWRVWNNRPATTTTETLPSAFPAGGKAMIHVTTTALQSGLSQIFHPIDTDRAIASAWIFVKKGRVGIGIGNDDRALLNAITSSTGRWEYLQAASSVSPANELVVYSDSEDGADFFVADPCVSNTPRSEWLPPLEFGYARFEPDKRRFSPITGPDMPPSSLASPDYDLVDVFGNGLPDILEMNGTVRSWRNRGDGTFDWPRPMTDAPAGYQLANPGVQFVDADGDGRSDLLVTTDQLSGYFPLRFGGAWGALQRHKAAPTFDLKDPEVKLVDLDGDGVTDVLRSGSRLECYFNDRLKGWTPEGTRWVERPTADGFPGTFSDPRVKWADMTGDGLQDIVLVHDGSVEYWPNLGYGKWGRKIHMKHSPRFPEGYDPRRILIGDVDGDGVADLVYVDDTHVTLWINQSGNGWSEAIPIEGTPPVTEVDAVRLTDLLGVGVAGVLWSRDATELPRPSMFFLDLTGKVKPYLLSRMDNHIGAVTRVAYAASTQFYLEDEQRPKTRWKTPLPFPVQVVAHVEVVDQISRGKLTTEYNYHHGYWDGVEREFRGFGRVDQRDTQTFETYQADGLHAAGTFDRVPRESFSPPTETRVWFHQGPIEGERGEWQETNFSGEFWPNDSSVLSRPPSMIRFLNELPRQAKRDAIRALRGQTLRTELYALDGDARQDRPYTVTEHLGGVCEVVDRAGKPTLTCTPPSPRRDEGDSEVPPRIFFPHDLGERVTQWERGHDPMTRFTFTNKYDNYGQPCSQTSIAVPRDRDFREKLPAGSPADKYLATHTLTDYAQRDDKVDFIVDRVARTTTYEIDNDGRATALALKEAIEAGTLDTPAGIVGQTLNFYDGAAFTGLPISQIGTYGALVRTETLVVTQKVIDEAYPSDDPFLITVAAPYWAFTGEPRWPDEYPQAFQDRFPTSQHADATRPGLELTPLGYGFADGRDPNTYAVGYFAATERRRYDFHDPAVPARGLIIAKRDPLGRDATCDTTIVYDAPYEILPSQTTDPVSLTTTVTYDYRVFQPSEVTDPNGNRSRFTFTPLGLLSETWILGKPENNEGDRQQPGATIEYDFSAFENAGQPIFVSTVRRTHHDTEDVSVPERDETIRTVEYSDGFGRVLQTRTQAEDLLFSIPRGDAPNDLVGWWKFDEGSGGVASDASGLNNNGELSGSATFVREPQFGSALEFTGADGAVLIRHDPRLEPETGTIEAWVKIAVPQNSDIVTKTTDRLVRTNTPAGDSVIGLRIADDGAVVALVANDDPASPTHPWIFAYSPAHLITPGKWHHLAMRWDGTALTVFVDGTRRASTPYVPIPGTGLSYHNGSALGLGVGTMWAIAPPHEFIGRLGDVRFYGTARSDSEVWADFATTHGENLKFGNAVLPPAQSGAGGDVVGYPAADPQRAPWVIVSGWQVYDNKGQIVEKYEPFFAEGWEYAEPTGEERGQRVTMYYDPRGHIIRTVNPDGSEQRLIDGVPGSIGTIDVTTPDRFEPTAWEAYTYDANDNAGQTHRTAAASYISHWNTPSSATLDPLGRTALTVQRNGPNPDTDWYDTQAGHDIRGNVLTVTDALHRRVFQYVYDLADRPLRIDSLDAGIRRIVLDAAGNEIERRDSKGALVLHDYDVLNRPVRLWARDDSTSRVTLREHLEYGDAGDPNQPDADREASRSLNLLGRLHRHYDEAGLQTFGAYDFKGNVLEKTRQVIKDEEILSVFVQAAASNWNVQAYRVDWEPQAGTSFEDHAARLLTDPTSRPAYQTSFAYDALNRVKTLRYPEDVSGKRKEFRPHYNRAGALDRIELADEPSRPDAVRYVERIAYNARAQRSLIAYSNGVMTRYAYNEYTFWLARMRSERYVSSQGPPVMYHPTAALQPLQDLAYAYDLAGNIIGIQERTPGCGVRNTSFGPDALDRSFTYDPLYRLLSATGRECSDIRQPRPWTDDPHCGFNSGNHGTPNQDNAPDLTTTYWEQYAYDPAGNMVALQHGANGNPWTRNFGMGGLTPQEWSQDWPNHVGPRAGDWSNPKGNRLTHVANGSAAMPQTHFFDANGNLTAETTSRQFEWDHSDRMRVYRTQTPGAEPSVHAHYLYGASGERVMKLVRKQADDYEVSAYVDGVFEHHRWKAGGMEKQNNHLYVMDNQAHVALARLGDSHADDPSPAVQYQLGDHLGSTNVVLDENGAWINREEYFPYRETSFGGFARKRYRSSGQERDEENGLYYHGARYYISWLLRWASPDPSRLKPSRHINPALLPHSYSYVRNRPVVFIDPNGREEKHFYIYLEPEGKKDKFLELAAKKSAEARQRGDVVLSVRGLDDLVNKLNEAVPEGDTVGTIKLYTHGMSIKGTQTVGLKLPSEEANPDKGGRPTHQTAETLEKAARRYGDELKALQGKMGPGARIEVHGCNFGKDEAGMRGLGRFFGGSGVTVTAPTVLTHLEETKSGVREAISRKIGAKDLDLDSPEGRKYMREIPVPDDPFVTRTPLEKKEYELKLRPKKDIELPVYQR